MHDSLAKMKIKSQCTSNPKVQIIEISSNLTGRGAIELQEYLLNRLDEGKLYQVIDLKHVRKIDGLGINILHKFISRGMIIRLFNVMTEIRGMIRLSGKDDLIKTYNETEHDKVVSRFEKEMLEEKSAFKDDVKRRCFQRVNTSLQTEFKSHNSHNGEITYSAVIENLSEGGVLIDKINAFNKKTEERVNALEIVCKELRDINFSLNGGSKLIVTNGECIWVNGVNEKGYAGIRFKNIKQNHKEMIKDYVYKQKNSQEIV